MNVHYSDEMTFKAAPRVRRNGSFCCQRKMTVYETHVMIGFTVWLLLTVPVWRVWTSSRACRHTASTSTCEFILIASFIHGRLQCI